MTTAEVAAYLKPAVTTVEHWRTRGAGPHYEHAGRRVLYRRKDVDDRLRTSTPHPLPTSGAVRATALRARVGNLFPVWDNDARPC
ncbi:helix-turn-helix domain-containing protein [Actinomyces faecalis]|uniref:helix-turn-helix domain-containing protein n=1 Tax=Actinomyces faecalis TaxID=2722820 RepID=UPI001552C1F4|nr:helix-turn-helix domain-containing protein [Actinomyces faecalis]